MMQKLLFGAFGIMLSTGLSAQILSGMTPAVGNTGQTLPIIISGQNTNFNSQGSGTISLFLSQGSFTIGQGSNTGFSNVAVVNGTTISATLSIPGSSTLGFYDLWVVGAGSSTLTKSMAFEVMQPSLPSVNVVPAGGQPGNTVNGTFTVTGASFKSSAQQVIEKVWLSFGNEVITGINNIQVINATTFTADVTLPASATQGMWDVNVYTDDKMLYTNPASFEVDNTFSRREYNQAHFNMYPNPVNAELNVIFEGQYSNVDIAIYDLSGKPVSRYSYEVQVLENGIKVNTEKLPKGSYMIQFISNDELIGTRQLVRE